MLKTTPFRLFALLTFSVAAIPASHAQIVGPDAYIPGTLLEIGVDGSGGFEGVDQVVSPPPAGMHARQAVLPFGFIANPQNNGWATYNGDFFTPGFPENGWGYEIGITGGTSRSNNCGSFVGDDIPGAIVSWSYTGTHYLVGWEGDDTTTHLHFRINYQLGVTDLFYVTTVTITNNTTDTIPELYYYRNVDPDNNKELNFDFNTMNTIISQPYGGGNHAAVSATQSDGSYFAFITDSLPGWRAAYGGFSNRDASDIWFATGSDYSPAFVQTVGDSLFYDCAIAIAYKVTDLLPAGNSVFKYCTAFADGSTEPAMAAMNTDLTTGINDQSLAASTIVYPNPFSDYTTIRIASAVKLQNAEVCIFDMLGKEVKRISGISTNEIRIDRNGLTGGMYFYKLINNNKETASGKLIVK